MLEKSKIELLKKLIATAVGVIMVITGLVFLFASDSHTGHNGGVSRASTSIEFGADFYSSSAQYTGLAANAVVDLYELMQNGIGFAFIFAGVLVFIKDGFDVINILVEHKELKNKELKEFGENSWTCKVCDANNNSNAKKCANCGQGRYDIPEDPKSSKKEWECPKCGNVWEGNVPVCTCGEERKNFLPTSENRSDEEQSICPTCGATIAQNQKYCSVCSTKIK